MNAVIDKLTMLLCTVAPELSSRTFSAQTPLREPALDPSALLLFALAVEDEFDIRITGSPKLETLGDVAEYIEKLITKERRKGWVTQ